MAIKKDTLHPEGEPEIDIYPKTSIDQVENLQANLDALNGDIANANGEIANISTNLETIYNRVEIAEERITVLSTAYESYTDYTEVTNGFLLTYLSGRQIELPIKAGTNVTFSKYPGSNQIVINATGGSVPDNIALLDANNTFSGSNTFSKLTYFNNQIALDINPISFNDDTKNMSLVFNYNGFIKRFVDTGNVYSINIPNKTGTIALTTDIPTLADYPTTIFFNNYSAGIGYKDTSTGTIKTVVSTDNNGAQIVLGDSNTGLTLATNARPKVLEDSTVKEVAYVSDIPNTSSFATLTGNNNFTGSNTFEADISIIPQEGNFCQIGYNNIYWSDTNVLAGFTWDSIDFHLIMNEHDLLFPNKTGTIALTSDIPNTSSFPTLAGSNNWTGQNAFDNGITMGTTEYTPEGPHVYYGDYRADYGERWISTQYQDKSGVLNLPQGKSGTLALIEDIPSGTSQDFSLYSDYEIVDKGFMLTYADGSKFELPIKAGTNVTFSKYPGTNQIIINATGGSGSVGDVYTSANNTFTGNNYFNGQVICANNKGLDIKSGVGTYRFIGLDNDCGITIIKPDLKIYRLVIPDKNGTLSTVEDIPISLMYSSSRLGVNSVDFPFNKDKNYFFTITMTNTGESKSFIYAKGTSSTYTIVINSSTSFEVKLDATGSSTRLIFTTKSNVDPFVVRAEISN